MFTKQRETLATVGLVLAILGGMGMMGQPSGASAFGLLMQIAGLGMMIAAESGR